MRFLYVPLYVSYTHVHTHTHTHSNRGLAEEYRRQLILKNERILRLTRTVERLSVQKEVYDERRPMVTSLLDDMLAYDNRFAVLQSELDASIERGAKEAQTPKQQQQRATSDGSSQAYFSQVVDDLKRRAKKCENALADVESKLSRRSDSSDDLTKAKTALELVVEKWKAAESEIERLKRIHETLPPPTPPVEIPPSPSSITKDDEDDCFRKQFEFNTARDDGEAFYDFSASSPRLCRDECVRERQCRTWVFVKAQKRCFLKENEQVEGRASSCCVSGIKCESA